MRRRKSTFGRLLAAYRSYRGVSQTALWEQLLNERGYALSLSAINKYEFGDRDPSPEFIYHVAQILELTEDEVATLLDACIADMTSRFLEGYNEVLKREQGIEKEPSRALPKQTR